MSLINLWKKSENDLRRKTVEQLIGFAGEGRLIDGSACSEEFRAFLGQADSAQLHQYLTQCLDGFDDSGLALQDIVNQVGIRLGFSVTNGRYRGKTGAIGFDGIWKDPSGHSLVIEVKTTDAYRIQLDSIASYRRRLASEGQLILEESSILLVVGRQDTGDLEAQVRGSRNAWDIRLISVEALLRLLLIKQETETPDTQRRILGILKPHEYTRVDGIIDLVFSTAEDVQAEEKATIDSRSHGAGEGDDANRTSPAAFHDGCIERISKSLSTALIRKSKSSYQSTDGDVLVVCLVSKAHEDRSEPGYWYAFHPHQKDGFSGVESGFVAFGCGSPDNILLMPASEFIPLLDGMNQTEKEGRSYWHVHIHREGKKYFLARKHGVAKVDLTKYYLNVRGNQ